jgi:hypothetical protein
LKEEEQDKIWKRISKGGPIPRRTGRLTVGRKKSSNSNSIHFCTRHGLHCKLQTRSLVREDALHEEQQVIFKRKKKIKSGRGPQRGARYKDGPDRSTDRRPQDEPTNECYSFSCGGRLVHLHRSPASRKVRRKGNPVPGGITGPLCSWGI